MSLFDGKLPRGWKKVDDDVKAVNLLTFAVIGGFFFAMTSFFYLVFRLFQ